MNAVHWLRTRQEKSELYYWLSIVSYDEDDHSFSNRVYLIYLFIFFSIWLFAVLTYFAKGGAAILNLINADEPTHAAVFLEILILGGWNLLALWQSLKRCPILFSEQDAAWLCQTPVNRRTVVMRWFFLPWLKSAVPFWLLTVIIGFSVAEITMAGSLGTNSISGYFVYGFRAWMNIIPIQLALFSLQWIFGVLRLQKDIERKWLIFPIMFFAFLIIGILLAYVAGYVINPLARFSHNLILLIRAGFDGNNLILCAVVNWLSAFLSIAVLYWISNSFSLTRAAQETKEIEKINEMSQLGFTSYANELKTRQKLGVSHVPSRIPKSKGVGILIWKDIMQSNRNWNIQSIFDWIVISMLPMVLVFIPDVGNLVFSIAFWSIQLGKLSVKRLRNDLSCWQIIRQLPISNRKFILFELSPPYFKSLFFCMLGLIIISLIKKPSDSGLLLLIPGIIAGVIGTAAFDVIRRAKSGYLLNGSAPDVSVTGYLLGLISAIVPIILGAVLPEVLHFILPFLASLLLGFLSLLLAIHAYDNIDK